MFLGYGNAKIFITNNILNIFYYRFKDYVILLLNIKRNML